MANHFATPFANKISSPRTISGCVYISVFFNTLLLFSP